MNKTAIKNFILHQKMRLFNRGVERHKLEKNIAEAFEYAFPGEQKKFKEEWCQMEREGLL